MEDWSSQHTILRLVAVLFIMITAFDRSKEGKILKFLALPVIVAAVVLHYLGEGFDGLRFSLLGMITTTALTLPLYMLKRVTRTELAIACAFGGILGFAGSSMAFLIAFVLLAIQHLLEADSVPVSDNIISVSTTSGAGFLTKDEKSALAEIEARKILRSDSTQFKNLNFENKDTDDVPSHKSGHRHVDILPWRVKLALAALTILLLGVP